MNEQKILDLLKKTKKQALAKYSKFHVSALLVTQDKYFVTGFNIESSSYGLTICAERVALFKALSEGHRKFDRIYIMSDLKEPCPPCGACRQVLMDYAPNLKVIMYSSNGKKSEALLDDLIPFAFQGQGLSK